MNKMPTYKLDAIILKRINFGEADRLVTAFSKEHGKVKFIAKGSRKTKSKLAGSIEPFCRCDLLLARGRNLDLLTGATVIRNYLDDDYDLNKIKFASFVAEILDKLSGDLVENVEVFELVDSVLSSITEIDSNKLKVYFLSNFLSIYGVMPQLSACVKCDQKIEGEIYFSRAAGGLLDSVCQTSYGDTYVVQPNSVKAIRAAQEGSLEYFKKIRIPESYILESLEILNGFLKFTLIDKIKSDSI